MILCIGITPAAQRVMVFRRLALDAVNRAATTLDGAAGKSINVAKVLKILGEQPLATGFLGGDRGEFLRRELTAKNIAQDFFTVAARTRECATVIDEADGTVTELVEESSAVTPQDFESLLAVIQRRMPQCKAAVMSGTIVRGGPVDFYAQCVRMANEAGALSVVDAQGPALIEALKAQPTLVKPNRTELAATLGRDLNDDAALISAMQDLHQRGARSVVVTAGKDAVFAFNGKSSWKLRPPHVRAINPIGSGDAFTAGLVSRLIRGEQLPDACRWACATGAANALTLMPGELNPDDVERLVAAVEVEQL
jgi:tagatose 6-phosphate kinase